MNNSLNNSGITGSKKALLPLQNRKGSRTGIRILYFIVMVSLFIAAELILTTKASAVTGTPMYKWEKYSVNAVTEYTLSRIGSTYDPQMWTRFYRGYIINPDGTFQYTEPSTGPYCDRGWSEGCWYFGTSTRLNKLTDGLGHYDRYNCVLTTTYSKGTISYGAVYGAFGVYPNNGEQGGYWFDIIGESIANVTFESNGGSAVASQEVFTGSKVMQPTAPRRTGYTFAGWYSDTELTNTWSFLTNTVGDTDMTLYAKWTEKTSSGSSELGLSVTTDKEYSVPITLDSVSSFAGLTSTLIYDPEVLQLTDLCSFTFAKETTTGAIEGTGITITAFSPGEIEFTINKTIASGKQWTGILNIFKFQALQTGSTVISIQ